MLCCIVLYCAVLYCIVLYCMALYCMHIYKIIHVFLRSTIKSLKPLELANAKKSGKEVIIATKGLYIVPFDITRVR